MNRFFWGLRFEVWCEFRKSLLFWVHICGGKIVEKVSGL